MKTTLVVTCLIFLAGCSTTPVIKTEIVKVNVPVPFIPAPPEVPTISYAVDALTPADAKTPGKVGQAYVHDMTFLRERIKIDDMILLQYKNGSADFTAIERKIQELYQSTPTLVAPK